MNQTTGEYFFQKKSIMRNLMVCHCDFGLPGNLVRGTNIPGDFGPPDHYPQESALNIMVYVGECGPGFARQPVYAAFYSKQSKSSLRRRSLPYTEV